MVVQRESARPVQVGNERVDVHLGLGNAVFGRRQTCRQALGFAFELPGGNSERPETHAQEVLQLGRHVAEEVQAEIAAAVAATTRYSTTVRMNDGPPVRETFAGLAAESDSGIEELWGILPPG